MNEGAEEKNKIIWGGYLTLGKVDRYVGSLTFCAAPWGNRIWKGVTIYLYGGKRYICMEASMRDGERSL